jgi:drug/metabolite transporter (DMT)-like permease
MMPSAFASVFFGLAAAITWGTGDFSGGLATRRAPVTVVLLCSQLVGITLVTTLALLARERLPSPADMAWGAAAGIAGLVGLASLYRAMSLGQMGTVAPVSGVVSAALPVIAGALTQGLPAPLVLLGFVFALTGVWFISRSGSAASQGADRTTSILLALVSGAGFGGFLILIAQAQNGAVFWPLAVARAASLLVVLVWLLFKRSIQLPPRNAIIPIIAAGTMDAGGNLFFLLSAQSGRLDIAGVLSSLYPATTVILALTILRERLIRSQFVGIALALIAIPMISLP